MDMNEINSIISELSSIVKELEEVENDLRNKFHGIGTDTFIAPKLSEKTWKLKTALGKLRTIDKSQVDEE